jgi:hypothetical protein
VFLFDSLKKYDKILAVLTGVNYGGPCQLATRYPINSIGLRRALN